MDNFAKKDITMKKLFLIGFMCLISLVVRAQTKGEFVDLGLPSGTTWASKNEESLTIKNYAEKCTTSKSWLPTKEQIDELIDECRWTWTGRGYRVTGPNGKSIYLPAEGSSWGWAYDPYGVGQVGYYWASDSKNSDGRFFDNYQLWFNSKEVSAHWEGCDYYTRYSLRLVSKTEQRLKLEEEERLERERLEEEQRKEDEYIELLQNASEAERNGRYYGAWSNYRNALRLFPERNTEEITRKMNRCDANNQIQLGDNALNMHSYDHARNHYNSALTYGDTAIIRVKLAKVDEMEEFDRERKETVYDYEEINITEYEAARKKIMNKI